MVRHVFFSFHYDRDIHRVSQVRNSWVTQGRTIAEFRDGAAWETAKRKGDQAIKNWIENQLKGTSVTVVLIGSETASRKFVLHEIERSRALGKGIVGVRIHQMKNFNREIDLPGRNPLTELGLDHIYNTYDYVTHSGYHNMSRWIEEAAHAAGR